MSVASMLLSDYDFWEFASCGRCQLPFTTPTGITVPFWLTECGHIVCNTHLNVNQSCSICGSPGIQLVPLQREMEAPMSEWFQSIPFGLDAIANAAKFQFETMASQIRHYRTRHQQQRVLIERLKHDIGELKKDKEQLSDENNQLHEQLGSNSPTRRAAQQPDLPNVNGKRPRDDAHSYPHENRTGMRASTSSPHSGFNQAGPARLTLPQGQAVSNIFDATAGKSVEQQTRATHVPNVFNPSAQHRPASGFVEKYAYVAPSTARAHLQHTSQSPLQTFSRKTTNQEDHQTGPRQLPPQSQAYGGMPPPSTPARFKVTAAHLRSANQPPRRSRFQPASTRQQQKPMAGPHSQTRPGGLQSSFTNNQGSGYSTSDTGTNRFFPVAQHLTPSESGISNSIGNVLQEAVSSDSRAPSRAQNLNFKGGGQRAPFIPRQNPGEFN